MEISVSEKDSDAEIRGLLDILQRHHAEVQQQLAQQSVGVAMLPQGVLNNLRRASESLIEGLREEDNTLQSAIHVLLTRTPGCLEAALEILTGRGNSLCRLEFELKHRVLH